MSEPRVKAFVNKKFGSGKPYELCVGVYMSDTRLEHEDYGLNDDELNELHDSIRRIIDGRRETTSSR